MNILIFSDSHGETTNMIDIISDKNPDYIIHLGDFADDSKILSHLFKHVIYVKGNNDNCDDSDNYKIVTIDNFRFFICHGHNFDVYLGQDKLIEMAALNNCNVALYGHTHIKHKSIYNDILILNPGSISYPRDDTKSYAQITISDNALDAKLITLGE